MPDIVILFFLLGILAGVAKSDLKVPKAAYDTLSILLMLTLGLKGGLALHGRLSLALLPEICAVLALGGLIPLLIYPVARKLLKLDAANSASLAAHYGSTSAGTFAVALAVAEAANMPLAPQTTLYLVLLELPAILVGIILYRKFGEPVAVSGTKAMLHEAFTSRGVLLLAGGLIIGCLYGPEGSKEVTPLFIGAFKALLALFLLEMGLCTAKTLYPLPWHQWRLFSFGLLAPGILGLLGLGLGLTLGLPSGSLLVLTALSASASYIAAPAAIASAIPKADIGQAMLASLGVTFPFNVLLGIGLYQQLILGLS